MDDRRFDAFVRGLATGRNRRSLLKGLLGLGGLTATGAVLLGDADAARRGASSPDVPAPDPAQTPPVPPVETPVPATETPACAGVICNDGCCTGACTATGACCPAGSTVCGPDCCPNDRSTCCDGACCFGTCYGEELCCPDAAMCGETCCAPAERCCAPDSPQPACIPGDGCCSDDDCEQGGCIDYRCEFEPPPEPPSISLALGTDCLAQLTLTNFPPGVDLPALRLFGKRSLDASPVELDRLLEVPIPFLGTLVYTFGFDLGAGGYVEVQAEADTGSSVYPANSVAVTCVRPTPTPTATPLSDPRVTLTVGTTCELTVSLTGFGAGTEARIAVNGRNSGAPVPFEIPILLAPSVTIGSDGSVTLPPLPIDPSALAIDQVRARVSIGRNRYGSGWVAVVCQRAQPVATRTPRPRRR